MANICDTCIQFRGDDAKLQDLFSRLECKSLTEIAEQFDISELRLYNEFNPFRGNIIDIDASSFCVYQEDAYEPHVEIWYELIRKHYNSALSFVYKSEGPDSNIFINTDDTGIHFPERYVCDYYTPETSDVCYFETEKDLVAWASELLGLGRSIISIDELPSLFKQKYGENGTYISIGHFENQ